MIGIEDLERDLQATEQKVVEANISIDSLLQMNVEMKAENTALHSAMAKLQDMESTAQRQLSAALAREKEMREAAARVCDVAADNWKGFKPVLPNTVRPVWLSECAAAIRKLQGDMKPETSIEISPNAFIVNSTEPQDRNYGDDEC